MPILCQFELAIQALESVQTQHEWEPIIIDQWAHRRPLAGAWNEGIRRALNRKCDFVMISNDDIIYSPWSIDKQVEYLKNNPTCIITTGYSAGTPDEIREHPECDETYYPGATGQDFSNFMIRPATVGIVGWFDENFNPVHLEDLDYLYRAKLSGYEVKMLTYAPHYHYFHKSWEDPRYKTTHEEWEHEHEYYARKWGGPPFKEVYKHPFNNKNLDLKYWEIL